MKKLFSLLSLFSLGSLTLGLNFVPVVLAQTFSDLSASDEHYVAIEYLVTTGTLEGYSDNTFRPEQAVNRAEALKILVLGQGIEPSPTTYQSCFPDVLDDWYAPYVCYAKTQGWVEGYPDGTFKPADTVNKVEAIKMVINSQGLSDELPVTVDEVLYNDTDSSAWYGPYLWVGKTMNIVEDDAGYFYPDDDMDRGSGSEVIFRVRVVEGMGASVYSLSLRDSYLEQEGLSYLAEENAEATVELATAEGLALYGVFAEVHLEVASEASIASLWDELEALMALADRYDFHITLLFTPQWGEYVLESSARLAEVREWEAQGHELGVHHHGTDHLHWDGYTDDPAFQDDPEYEGDIDDMMAILNQLPASGQMVSCGCQEAESEWPDGLLYQTTNSGSGAELVPEEMISTPEWEVYNGQSVLVVGKMSYAVDHIDNAPTLEEIEEAVYDAGFDQTLGLVFNDSTLSSRLDEVEVLFDAFAAWGVRVESVEELLSAW